MKMTSIADLQTLVTALHWPPPRHSLIVSFQEVVRSWAGKDCRRRRHVIVCLGSIHGSFYINTSYLKCQSQILIVWIRVPSTTEASSTGNTNWQPTHCLSSNERHRTHNTWEEVFDPRLRPMSFVFAAAMHRHSTVVVNGRGNESNGRIS